jgi:hypothetical protein
MKNAKYIILALFVLCLLNSCVATDPISITEINIVNESSYDLHISFYPYPDIKMEHFPSYGWDNDFDLLKNKSVSYELRSGPVGYEDPNDKIEKALFVNMKNNEEIKKYNNNNRNLFNLIGTETNSIYGGTKASYLLTINDAFLQ